MDQRTTKLMTMYKGLHPRDDVDSICQENKEEEDSPTFKIALMHQYNESNRRLHLKKNAGEDWLQRLKTIQTT